MGSRQELHEVLTAITPNVYFQPPAGTAMEYPCIVYRRDPADTAYADNNPYTVRRRYLVTSIDRDPDSEIPVAISKLPTAIHNRSYPAKNLNHDAYQLYF